MKISALSRILFLSAIAIQGASGLTRRNVSLGKIAAVPRGGGLGNSNENGKTAASSFRSLKEHIKEELATPHSKASGAMVSSLLLFFGAMFTVHGMNIVQTLYPTDGLFWGGSPKFQRPGALEHCRKGNSVLFDFPSSVSESLAETNQVTAVLVGSYLTLTSLMILASKIGSPSTFPIPSRHYRTIFNMVRMVAPFFATFFIPRVPTSGSYGSATKTLGDIISTTHHASLATFSFFLSPLTEMISGVMELVSFFYQSDRFLPSHPSDEGKASSEDVTSKLSKATDIVYKSIWVTATLARTVLAYFLFFHLLKYMLHNISGTSLSQVDACGSLRSIRSFAVEKTFVGFIGSLYVLLAISQLCESSGRKVTSLLYLLPISYIGIKAVGKHVATLLMTQNMKENYLKIIGIPASGFWSLDSNNIKNLFAAHPDYKDLVDLNTCTAKLDLSSVPDNCFELAANPQ